MNISIAIADTNREYLKRLAEVLQEYNELTVSVFSSEEKLEMALENSRFDIVLFDPDISERKLVFSNVKLWVCLYSEDAQNRELYSECEKVIKYQRVSRLYKEVIKLYADKAGYMVSFNHSQDTKIIAVYSPVGGSGKTTVALGLAAKYAMQGENVLFMSMEQLDASTLVNGTDADGDGITMLLESIEGNSNFDLKLKGLAKKGAHNISYIEGFDRIVDYNTITKTEIKEVLERIRKSGEFHTVIVDMGSCLDAIGHVIFEIADNIIIVEKCGEIEDKKMEIFSKQAITREYKAKMCLISNFSEGNRSSINILNIPIIGKVHNYRKQSLKDIMQSIAVKENITLGRISKGKIVN